MDPGIAITTIQVIEIALKFKELTTAEDLVNGNLLCHITHHSTNSARISQSIDIGHMHRTAVWSQKC